MKKIIITLGFVSLCTTMVNAMVDENKTSDIEGLRQNGYSESTLRVLDGARSRSEGPKYKRQFSNEPRGKYHNVKVYFDPYQDDDNFGEHQIEFTNTWMGDNAFYTTEQRYQKKVEDL